MTRRRILVAACVWLFLSVSLAASNSRPAVILLGSIVAVVAAVIVVMLDLGRGATRVEWTRRRPVLASTRGKDPRVASLRSQLYDARWFGSAELRGTLIDLIDDRLLAHRHIDRASDPEAAMDALPPQLRQLVAHPRRSVAGVGQLERILSDIESL